jgi:hypothetical protein
MFKRLQVTLTSCTSCLLLLFSNIGHVKQSEQACIISAHPYSPRPLPDFRMCYVEDINQAIRIQDSLTNHLRSMSQFYSSDAAVPIFSLAAIKTLLEKPSNSLHQNVILKVLSALKCAQQYHIQHNQVLTIIDYSLPSNEKRLWIFDLLNKRLLFHTYVSHGIKSGTLFTSQFSNKYNSKATSIGVYSTEQTYFGRDGISLRLDGLDRGFNDNAANRSIVMHGGWYVDEGFIKKYGRAGRSWGCPAVPNKLSKSIINTIKDKSIFIAYYPNDDWFSKSKFLKCVSPTQTTTTTLKNETPLSTKPETEARENVLFAEVKHRKQIDSRPVVAVSALRYEQIFHLKAPIERMLRRQVNGIEYIAVSNLEFKQLIEKPDALDAIQLIEPVIKEIRGYHETQLKIVSLGKIQDIKMAPTEDTGSYTIRFGNSNIHVKATDQFVRWVGL